MTAFSELKPWYFGWFDLGKKHMSAVWHYFWSYQFLPTPIDGSSDKGASARTSDDRIRELMNSDIKLIHHEGARTKTPQVCEKNSKRELIPC